VVGAPRDGVGVPTTQHPPAHPCACVGLVRGRPWDVCHVGSGVGAVPRAARSGRRGTWVSSAGAPPPTPGTRSVVSTVWRSSPRSEEELSELPECVLCERLVRRAERGVKKRDKANPFFSNEKPGAHAVERLSDEGEGGQWVSK